MQHAFPFDLSAPVTVADVEVSGDAEEMAIALGSAQWAFGCTFLPSPALANSCAVALDILVLSGAVAIGTLPASGRYFFDEASMLAKSDWQRVCLRVPNFAERGTLILRNATGQPSRLRLRVVKVADWQPDQAELQELQAIEDLLDASARLAEVNPANSLLKGSANGPLRSALEPLVERLGLAVIAPNDPDFGDFLGALADSDLAALAQSMVVPANCKCTPGWTYGWAESQPQAHWQLRSAVWRAMRDRCPDVAITLPWLGNTQLQMPLASDLSRPLFTVGQFEPNIFRLITPMLRSGDTVIDVGANEGLYSLLAASVLGPDGLTIAVEPSQRELGRLVNNIALNGFEDRVVIVDAALSGEAGWAEFAVAEAAHGGQNAFAHQFNDRLTTAELRATATLTLDMLAQRLPDRVPDFIKIDVEGAEFDVLRGADSVIDQARPIWLIEIGRTGADGEIRVVQRLAESHYVLFAVDDVLGAALRLSSEADWTRVENMIAVPREKLSARWPDAPAA